MTTGGGKRENMLGLRGLVRGRGQGAGSGAALGRGLQSIKLVGIGLRKEQERQQQDGAVGPRWAELQHFHSQSAVKEMS